MFDAFLKWGGVGSGPDKGGGIDLIVLCVIFLLGPWMAQPGPWTARPVNNTGLPSAVFCTALVRAYGEVLRRYLGSARGPHGSSDNCGG